MDSAQLLIFEGVSFLWQISSLFAASKRPSVESLQCTLCMGGKVCQLMMVSTSCTRASVSCQLVIVSTRGSVSAYDGFYQLR